MSINSIGMQSSLSVRALLDMRGKLNDLQRQLGTGKKSVDYAGLGLDRGLAVGLRARLAAMSSYGETIANVNVRLDLAQTALTRIDTVGRTVKGVTQMSPFDIDQTGQTTAQQTARAQLDEILSLLNTRAGDRYLFSGRAVTTPATETFTRIMNGDAGRAGLNQLIAERNQADLGANGLGRLIVPAMTPAAAQIAGTGASLLADAPAVYTGAADLSALVTAGGTLELNGVSIAIAAGPIASVLGDINAQLGVTGVQASLQGGTNFLVLTSVDADTPVTIGPATTPPQLLTDLDIAVGTTNPTNLLTQGAVTSGQTLTIAAGANPPLSVVFGTGVGEVSTLAELAAALGTLAGGTASIDGNGNISVTAGNTTDTITLAGTANLGNFGLSTLSAGPTGSVGVSEDVAGSPFGFKLVGMTSQLNGAVLTGPAGAPPAMSVNLLANPVAGETIRFTFALPDGSTEDVTLTASPGAPLGANEFAIATTPAATAANLQAALGTALGKQARTSLAAASAIAASRNFFDIGAGQPPQRVAGPPFATATALVAGTPADTVHWYTGEIGSDAARGTAVARADESISVSYGLRANEEALRWTVEHVAVFAAMTYSATDPDAQARFTALNQRLGPILDYPPTVQSIQDIEAQLAGAQTTMKAAADRHRQTSATLEALLNSIEGVSQEEAGAQILALQTRLQASMQTTAILFRTSIVEYL